jgi:hypothetical protein
MKVWIEAGEFYEMPSLLGVRSFRIRIHFLEPLEYETGKWGGGELPENPGWNFHYKAADSWKQRGKALDISKEVWVALDPPWEIPKGNELYEIDLSGAKPRLVKVWVPA